MGAFGVQRDMERNDVGVRGQFVERYVTIGGTQLLGRFARRVRAEYPESPCGGIPFHERTDVADADDAERQTGGRCLADRAGECGRYPLEYPAGVAARSGDDLYPVGGAPCRSMWSVPIVAVATIRTEEPASSAASQRVRVRTRSASASLTSLAVMALPGR